MPRAKAWRIAIEKTLRKFFEGLTAFPNDIRNFLDLIYLDLFPQTTRELARFDSEFGFPPFTGTEQARRDRLSGRWRSRGGQSPRYIQDTLQAAGFDVYVHDWWQLPVVGSPVPRNPFLTLIPAGVQAGEPLAQAGEDFAQAGNSNVTGGVGYMLVNKQLEFFSFYLGCGNEDMICGFAAAVCGRVGATEFVPKPYEIPDDSNKWPYIVYIGGETFPDFAQVPAARRNEFETLCLKLKPRHLWLGMLIEYTTD